MTEKHKSANNSPKISVIVAIVSDTVRQQYDLSHLTGCLEALTKQVDPPKMEIIVPFPIDEEECMAAISRNFSQVTFLPVDNLNAYLKEEGSREHHDELRARGLAAATGDIIALVEDHARPDNKWSAAMVTAHQSDYAGVGGAMENGIDRALNWAVYFLDFGRYQNPLPAGESSFVSDANVSYKGNILMSVREVWQSAFREPEVNWAITSRGGKLALAPKAIVFQYRKDLQLGEAIKERFVWGRSYAMTRSKKFNSVKRSMFAVLALLLPIVLLMRQTLNVVKKGRNRGAFLKALPLMVVLAVVWSMGEMAGYLTKSYEEPGLELERKPQASHD